MKWIFGYGSLLWRPGFDFEVKKAASIFGWERRIWHSSIDHRGTESFPGRVATIVPVVGGVCEGVAYGVVDAKWSDTLSYLDDREKAGYKRKYVLSDVEGMGSKSVVTYVSRPFNKWVSERETDRELINRIVNAEGESGRNIDYLMRLDRTLVDLEIVDAHIGRLVRSVCQSQISGEN